jgi:heptosyltransferase-3
VRILILHPGALGDILLSLPAIALLRQHQPGANITLACNSDYLEILQCGCVDKALTLATLPLHRMYLSDPLPEADLAFWHSYDRIVSWTGFGDEVFSRNFNRVHAQVIVRSWRPRTQEDRHVSRIFADSLYPWIPGDMALPQSQLKLGREVMKAGDRWLASRGWNASAPVLSLHPGAGSTAKRWKLDNFRTVMESILQQGLQILIIEGPAEAGLAVELAAGLSGDRILMAESIPLTLLAALLQRCCGFLGNDSGIAHLAATLQVPSVVLFGPTLPEQWAPLGKRVILLRNSHDCPACSGNTGVEHTCLDALAPALVTAELTRIFRHASPVPANPSVARH